VTTITIERELLWQALDALETCAGAPCVDRAKNAVREYLALPAPDDRHALRVIKQMDGYTPAKGGHRFTRRIRLTKQLMPRWNGLLRCAKPYWMNFHSPMRMNAQMNVPKLSAH